MGRAPCCEKVGLKRGPWTSVEDMRLIVHIKKHGEGAWRTLPKEAGLLRCGKSCRLRWFNYLRPNIKKGNISKDEENLIIKLHSILGNRWSLIASKLPGRTDNEIKNHWNAHLKKRLFALGIDPKTHEPFLKVDKEKIKSQCNRETCVSKQDVMGSTRNSKFTLLEKESEKFETHSAQRQENCMFNHPNEHGNINVGCIDNKLPPKGKSIEMSHQKNGPPAIDVSKVSYNNIYAHKDRELNTNQTVLSRLSPNISFATLGGCHEALMKEWSDDSSPMMPNMDPSMHTWAILENDFIWDQIDMLHALKGCEIVISSSPRNTENYITQLDDLWGSTWINLEQ